MTAIDRPVHREQCPCGQTYVGSLDRVRPWRLEHAKHWEVRDD